MALKQKVLQINQEFKDWLNATFAPKVHSHDDKYSKLGHTHGALQTLFEPRGWSTTQIHEPYLIYETPCDGWLRGSGYSGNCIYLLTHSIEDVESNGNRIEHYDSSIAYKRGDMIRLTSLDIYQCLSNTSAGQAPSTHPAKWLGPISEHTPCIMHSIASAASSADSNDASVIIPVAKGTKCMIAGTGDGGEGVRSFKSPITGVCTLSFIPFDKDHTKVLRSVSIGSNASAILPKLLMSPRNQTLAGLFLKYHDV